MNPDPLPASPASAADVPVLEMDRADVPGFERGERAVLKEVTWRMEAGEFHVIGGMPGSGKSALLAAAAGLLEVEEGEVRLFGQALGGLSEAQMLAVRRRVGFVFAEGGRLFHDLTVAQNVSLPLRYHRGLEERDVADEVARLLQATGLAELGSLSPGRLGRHQRPRIALARALALQPELVFLDGPLAGLDPREVRWWLEFLPALAEGHPLLGGKKAAVGIVTHSLRPWLAPGRRFFWVQEGRFEEAGGMEALQASENAVLRELLAEG